MDGDQASLCVLFCFRIMHCCIPTPTTNNNTSTDVVRVTLNMGRVPRTVGEMSWNCQRISHCLESGHPAQYLLAPGSVLVAILSLIRIPES